MEPLDAYLRLYERQMAHYEKTQDVEWKGSFGVWALLAAAIVWASNDHAVAKSLPAWALAASFAIPAAHTAWLLLVHRSEERDKKLWCGYRGEAEKLLGATSAEPYQRRGWKKEAVWLILEAGVSFGMTLVLVLFLAGVA